METWSKDFIHIEYNSFATTRCLPRPFNEINIYVPKNNRTHDGPHLGQEPGIGKKLQKYRLLNNCRN